MEGIYLAIVVLLFSLAILDLVVGVSNDAVNFLNSAIGSKVASRRTIMIIASLGILLGAVFSSGMMEIARKGIFNPVMFNMEEVMVLFMAVMITDILLLDVFNSLGLPTSTTVSIVFELLGATLCLALLKIGLDPNSGYLLKDYMNTESAMTIISGIFLSVGIAFSVGIVVMYISRLLFSFRYNISLKWFGSVFAGLSITAIGYFTIIKGLKGSSFVTPDMLDWVKGHTIEVLLWSFLGTSLLIQVLFSAFRVNPLRIVVLAGTFALAMAFAGNDLVNFIGVPVTGFQSYLNFSASGVPASEFMMGFLAEPIKTPTYLLVISGLVMVLTLWFSAKAKKVTETEVGLSRQDEGDERFGANAMSRILVGSSLAVGRAFEFIVPKSISKVLDTRFTPAEENYTDADAPAFDLVRASVNLMVAAILIAFATSVKLPLSTTYVSFMVAMGSSLADRAWGRESAVYRVAGVVNVILGWFVTALVALVASALIALLLYFLGFAGAIALFGLALYFLFRSHLSFKKKSKAETEAKALENKANLSMNEFLKELLSSNLKSLAVIQSAYRTSISGLYQEKSTDVNKALGSIKQMAIRTTEAQQRSIKTFRKLKKSTLPAAKLYILALDIFQDLIATSERLVQESHTYIRNHHKPVKGSEFKELLAIQKQVESFQKNLMDVLATGKYEQVESLNQERKAIQQAIDTILANLIAESHSKDLGAKKGALLMLLYLETKDLLAAHYRLAKLYRDYHRTQNG